MLKKRTIIIASLIPSVIFSLLGYWAWKDSKIFKRDTSVLLNRYYLLRDSNPKAAVQALKIILAEEPENRAARTELQRYGLSPAQSLVPPIPGFSLASIHLLPSILVPVPSKRSLEQSQYLWLETANQLGAMSGKHIGLESSKLPSTLVAVGNVSSQAQLMDQFYALKKQDPKAAWNLVLQITARFPRYVLALKEAGYLALTLQKRLDAISLFTRVYELTFDPAIAMQLAYLYDMNDNKPRAFRYFADASQAKDKDLALRAEKAMTNLAGLQTRAFPKPYFSEIFFDPFSQNRFGLTVRPLVARLGIDTENSLRARTYLVFRQTDDNNSTGVSLGQLPQIYEDNVRIIGFGQQIQPFAKIPVTAFVEAGAAYDLFYRNRDRWRGDLRGGAMYYQELGEKRTYTENWRVAKDYYGILYADATYFSRYNNNVIATLRTHQGIRLLQHHTTMVNLYLSGRLIEDKNRDFFNNFAEVGPGIGFIPYNRFNFEIRFEYARGVYLPAGNSPNPYSKYYNVNSVQLHYYVKL